MGQMWRCFGIGRTGTRQNRKVPWSTMYEKPGLPGASQGLGASLDTLVVDLRTPNSVHRRSCAGSAECPACDLTVILSKGHTCTSITEHTLRSCGTLRRSCAMI